MSECNICKENPNFNYNWDFWKNLKHSCQICGEDTTNNHSGYFNAHLCCIKHTKYVNASYFMIPIIKKELGYLKIDKNIFYLLYTLLYAGRFKNEKHEYIRN
jgi:hypothetical protein